MGVLEPSEDEIKAYNEQNKQYNILTDVRNALSDDNNLSQEELKQLQEIISKKEREGYRVYLYGKNELQKLKDSLGISDNKTNVIEVLKMSEKERKVYTILKNSGLKFNISDIKENGNKIQVGVITNEKNFPLTGVKTSDKVIMTFNFNNGEIEEIQGIYFGMSGGYVQMELDKDTNKIKNFSENANEKIDQVGINKTIKYINEKTKKIRNERRSELRAKGKEIPDTYKSDPFYSYRLLPNGTVELLKDGNSFDTKDTGAKTILKAPYLRSIKDTVNSGNDTHTSGGVKIEKDYYIIIDSPSKLVVRNQSGGTGTTQNSVYQERSAIQIDEKGVLVSIDGSDANLGEGENREDDKTIRGIKRNIDRLFSIIESDVDNLNLRHTLYNMFGRWGNVEKMTYRITNKEGVHTVQGNIQTKIKNLGDSLGPEQFNQLIDELKKFYKNGNKLHLVSKTPGVKLDIDFDNNLGKYVFIEYFLQCIQSLNIQDGTVSWIFQRTDRKKTKMPEAKAPNFNDEL